MTESKWQGLTRNSLVMRTNVIDDIRRIEEWRKRSQTMRDRSVSVWPHLEVGAPQWKFYPVSTQSSLFRHIGVPADARTGHVMCSWRRRTWKSGNNKLGAVVCRNGVNVGDRGVQKHKQQQRVLTMCNRSMLERHTFVLSSTVMLEVFCSVETVSWYSSNIDCPTRHESCSATVNIDSLYPRITKMLPRRIREVRIEHSLTRELMLNLAVKLIRNCNGKLPGATGQPSTVMRCYCLTYCAWSWTAAKNERSVEWCWMMLWIVDCLEKEIGG